MPRPRGNFARLSVNRNPSPSFWLQTAHRTWGRTGAKIGLVWIGVLALLAVFAPLLANSHPLLLVRDGSLTSPALAHFTAADFSLLAIATIAPAAFFFRRRRPLAARLTAAVSGSLVAVIAATSLASPPILVVHEQYRENRADYQWVLNAPIPLSPRDYRRDGDQAPLRPPLAGSEIVHWLGTDQNGADVASRLIHASRVALGIGVVATLIALFIGCLIGGLMGYFAGIADIIGMRLVEIFEAIPTLFLLLTFVAFFDRNLYIMMAIIGLTSWSGYARYTRAEFLRLRSLGFVRAAIAGGLPLKSVLFRHMLPNGINPILVAASFGMANAILAESVLSFLGLGVVDEPSWGELLSQATHSSRFNWWMALFPGGAIFLTVLAYNLLADALRDALNPSSSGFAP